MRQKVQIKNLKKPFWKFYYEKDIEIYYNGGWHFNSILTPEEIDAILDEQLAGSGTAESRSTETTKYGNGKSNVDRAFDELMATK